MSLPPSKTYLGEFWTPLLCFGWIRSQGQEIPKELVNIVINYFQISTKDLPLSWYPIQNVTISTHYEFPQKPEDYPNHVEIDIKPHHSIEKEFSCIILGTIRSQPERYLNWRLVTKRPKLCPTTSLFHLGCISVTKNKDSERIIIETVKSIDILGDNYKIFPQFIEKCELAETKSWWISHNMNQPASSHHSTWNEEQMQTKLAYLGNEMNVYGRIKINGSFTKRIGGSVGCKVNYEKFTRKQTNMMIVIVPHCMCSTKHNASFHFFISRQPHSLTGHPSRLQVM